MKSTDLKALTTNVLYTHKTGMAQHKLSHVLQWASVPTPTTKTRREKAVQTCSALGFFPMKTKRNADYTELAERWGHCSPGCQTKLISHSPQWSSRGLAFWLTDEDAYSQLRYVQPPHKPSDFFQITTTKRKEKKSQVGQSVGAGSRAGRSKRAGK